jgi:hypothetical protein
MICVGIGLSYSFSLSAVQKIIIAKLQGISFAEYIGWAQMVGRLSSIASTIILGLAMSAGWSLSLLLVLCGVLGIAGSIFLLFIKCDEKF